MKDRHDQARWPLKEWYSKLRRMQEMISIEHTVEVEFRLPTVTDPRKILFVQLKTVGNFYPMRLDRLVCQLKFHAKELRHRRPGCLKFIEAHGDAYVYEYVTQVPSTMRMLAESHASNDFSIESLRLAGYAGKILLIDRRLTQITHQGPCASFSAYEPSEKHRNDPALLEEMKKLN